MKRNVLVLLVMLFVSNYVFGQIKKTFELQGNILGLKTGSVVYLLNQKFGSNKMDTVSAVKTKGAEFLMKGTVSGDANYYFLKLDSNISTKYSNALWIANAKLFLKGSICDLANLMLTGSEPHDEFTKLKALHKSVRGCSNENDVLKQFVKDHRNSLYVSDLILKMASVYKTEGLIDTYKLLTDRAKNSYWGTKLGQIVETLEKNKLNDQTKIPNFFITSQDGEKISIHEVAARSKYTLIDFWASWCVPCRSAIPKLKKTYEEFHKKGFNIIGVSTDKSASAWKKALSEENMPWIQGHDNLENASQRLFSIAGIPSYVLIDENGRIVQSNILSAFETVNEESQIKRFKDKSLGTDIYEIVEKLLNNGKSK